jgi:hypothetical protein
MDISIGSYKFRMEIVILIVVVSWIMFGHLLCSCCTMTLQEGFDVARRTSNQWSNTAQTELEKLIEEQRIATAKQMEEQRIDTDIKVTLDELKNPYLSSLKKVSLLEKLERLRNQRKRIQRIEGFVGSNNAAYGPEFEASKAPGYIMKPDTWAMPTLTYSKGTAPDAGVKAIWDREKQPIPLPEGELDMFATTPFKPECCPNAYSSSEGCACMTVDQYDFLQNRGSNNVPYSEY